MNISHERRRKNSERFLTVFLSIFIIVGLAMLVMSARELISDRPDWEKVTAAGVVGFLFSGVPGLVLYFVRRSRKSREEEERLREEFPESPWLWKKEWRENRLQCSGKLTVIVAWCFTLFWNAISTPLLFALPKEVIDKKNYPALLGLMFPLVGVGLICWAIYATKRWRNRGSAMAKTRSSSPQPYANQRRNHAQAASS